MTLSVRRVLAAVAATATVIALAGCGGDDSGAADEADEPATSSAAASDSASPSADDESSSDDGGEEAAAPATGTEISGEEFAALLESALEKATTAHLTMELGGQGSAEGDADYSKTPPELAMKMTMAALGGDIEVRIVDGNVYIKSAAMSGDKWISIPLDDPNGPLGSLGSQLDPTQQFEAFAGAVTSATFDGPQDLDGESLDHYTATVDPEKLLQNMPEAAGQAGQLPDNMTQEWWFDGEGRIRGFTTEMGPLGAVSVKLSDWGADVEIEAPPSDQVTTMPGMAG